MGHISSFLISIENAAKANGGKGVDPIGLFTPTHLIFITIMTVLVALIIVGYMRAGELNPWELVSRELVPQTIDPHAGVERKTSACKVSTRKIYRIALAIAVFVLEFGKDAVLAATGQFTFANLPFELCSLATLTICWDAIHTSKASQTILYSLGLPGAAFALATPNWVTSPAINIFTWQAFLIHSLIVCYVLMRLIAKEFKPNFRDLWASVVFLAVFGLIDWRLNVAWGTNFMFLSIPGAGSPLELVYQIFGNFYVAGVALLVAVIWLLLYLPWELMRRNHSSVGQSTEREEASETVKTA